VGSFDVTKMWHLAAVVQPGLDGGGDVLANIFSPPVCSVADPVFGRNPDPGKYLRLQLSAIFKMIPIPD